MSRASLARQYRARRQQVVRRVAKEPRVDAVLIFNPTDVRYLAGGVEGVGVLLMAKGLSVAFTNRMFADRVPRECPGSEVVVCTKGAVAEAAERLRKERLRRVGYQEGCVSLAQYRGLCEAVGERKLKPVGNVLGEVRAVKAEAELRLMRKAVRIAERAFRELTAQGADHFVGKPERELAGELDYRMRALGADGQAFPGGIIVASGPNSAGCHHRPTSRRVRRDEPVLFDWGAEANGYRSDITRVVFTGKPSAKLREMYGVVLAAHDAAVAAIRPRLHAHRVDGIARGLITEAGYGKEFRHGLGHGLGLDVHEWPGFGKAAGGKPIPLRSGMVMTVEPGVYINGLGGIRIEDDILVTPAGHERLNRLPRRLEQMILR
ncbi:aminopeptidase P family protein [bacterium]|nr:aminopeptidase P family protein [bacterium]